VVAGRRAIFVAGEGTTSGAVVVGVLLLLFLSGVGAAGATRIVTALT
jgi:hypothetical protein